MSIILSGVRRRLLCVALPVAASLHAQEPGSLSAVSAHDRIAAAATGGLSNASVKTWHLKVEATLTPVANSPGTPASIEVWHTPEAERVVFGFTGAIATELTAGDGYYQSANDADTPVLLRDLLQAILQPGPMPADIEHSAPQLTHERFGNDSFDCVMLAQPLHGANRIPLGLFPTYCMLRDTNDLRVTYDFGYRSLLIRQEGKFGGVVVPVSVGLFDGPTEVAHGKVLALGSFNPASDDFAPGPDLPAVSVRSAKIAPSVTAGFKTGGPQPAYPQKARLDHVQGKVVLHAVIGREGHVRSLRVEQAPDADLAMAAIAAVRQWTYRPYTLNGVPTEVDTTITVNFNIAP